MGLRKSMILTPLLVLLVTVDITKCCYCPPAPFRDQFCESPFAIRGIVESGDEVWNDFERVYTRYTVRVEQVYREPSDETIGDSLTISVPYQSSMCGMTLTEGRDYIIGGYVYPSDIEKYEVNGCGLTEFYENLTADQLAGINGAYGCSL
ncbi:metalloproteinase inhibitor 3-like [Pecten maximus]|uniref:metalloproteinase inhibitor 3-like n=1 Tax=Pecten maximus TaxID=6579 RepID=UPI001458E2F6|nr:metalloproteinase inhibitor 3-like [Pecten maximus]